MEAFSLQAVCKDYPWGGDYLVRLGKRADSARIAESWELSVHPDGECLVSSGEYCGRPLSYVIGKHPEILGDCGRPLILVKLIDAKEKLSIQVHPDDSYAKEHGEDSGKTEFWYVTHAEEGASLLFGVKHPMEREEFHQAIASKTIEEHVKHVPVQKGDCFYIPAGTLHAIGGGIRIVEIQQSSNTTYRVYDYDRRDSDGNTRPLHIAHALAVTRLEPQQIPPQPHYRGGVTPLLCCPYFAVEHCEVRGICTLAIRTESFQHLLVTEGEGLLENGSTHIPLSEGVSVFIPAGEPSTIIGDCQVIVSFMPNK